MKDNSDNYERMYARSDDEPEFVPPTALVERRDERKVAEVSKAAFDKLNRDCGRLRSALTEAQRQIAALTRAVTELQRQMDNKIDYRS